MDGIGSIAGPGLKRHQHDRCNLGDFATGKQQALWPSDATVVLIDLCARIADCSPAATHLFCRQSEQLSGLPLSDIIPNLPFASETPIYNLAFAVFHSGNGASLQRTARTADGRTVPVTIALSSQMMNGKRHISLALMPSVTASATTSTIASTLSINPTRLGERYDQPN